MIDLENSTEFEIDTLNLENIANTSYVKGSKSTLNGAIQRDVMQENAKQLEFIKELENITNTTI